MSTQLTKHCEQIGEQIIGVPKPPMVKLFHRNEGGNRRTQPPQSRLSGAGQASAYTRRRSSRQGLLAQNQPGRALLP